MTVHWALLDQLPDEEGEDGMEQQQQQPNSAFRAGSSPSSVGPSSPSPPTSPASTPPPPSNPPPSPNPFCCCCPQAISNFLDQQQQQQIPPPLNVQKVQETFMDSMTAPLLSAPANVNKTNVPPPSTMIINTPSCCCTASNNSSGISSGNSELPSASALPGSNHPNPTSPPMFLLHEHTDFEKEEGDDDEDGLDGQQQLFPPLPNQEEDWLAFRWLLDDAQQNANKGQQQQQQNGEHQPEKQQQNLQQNKEEMMEIGQTDGDQKANVVGLEPKSCIDETEDNAYGQCSTADANDDYAISTTSTFDKNSPTTLLGVGTTDQQRNDDDGANDGNKAEEAEQNGEQHWGCWSTTNSTAASVVMLDWDWEQQIATTKSPTMVDAVGIDYYGEENAVEQNDANDVLMEMEMGEANANAGNRNSNIRTETTTPNTDNGNGQKKENDQPIAMRTRSHSNVVNQPNTNTNSSAGQMLLLDEANAQQQCHQAGKNTANMAKAELEAWRHEHLIQWLLDSMANSNAGGTGKRRGRKPGSIRNKGTKGGGALAFKEQKAQKDALRSRLLPGKIDIRVKKRYSSATAQNYGKQLNVALEAAFERLAEQRNKQIPAMPMEEVPMQQQKKRSGGGRKKEIVVANGNTKANAVLERKKRRSRRTMPTGVIHDGMEIGTGHEDGEEHHQQQQEHYCVCHQPYDPFRFYVGCDGCNGWFHPECVGTTQQEVADQMQDRPFFCPGCANNHNNNGQ